MALYVIGDLHLSLSGDKPMDVFGPAWENHTERLREAFSALQPDDVVVLAGDTSWGISLEEALEDFLFLDSLPGKKLLLKGNHDYWWGTAAKMTAFFAAHGITSLSILHNNCALYGGYALCGTRGWFYEEDAGAHTEKMLKRETLRLEASFRAAEGRPALCFLHYPPIYQGYRCPEILEVIDRYAPALCCYGHLHGQTHRRAFEGQRGNTEYSLISADYLRFVPKKLMD